MRFHSLRDARWFRQGAGSALACYLRLVRASSRFVCEPDDLHDRIRDDFPVIVTFWHGQHFLTPLLWRPDLPTSALLSRHRDAEINAIAAGKFGFGTIRGSGDPGGRFDRKGGVRAFVEMRKTLAQGSNVSMTADVPKVARVAGRGIVMLARASGRPIYPVCMATSRRIELNNWDRSAINLPFSRGATVLGEVVRVPSEIDDDGIEAYRQQVEASLNAATARAYELVDGPAGRGSRA